MRAQIVISCTTNYSLPDQSTKPPLWLYGCSFPPQLCCFWVIENFQTDQYKTTFLKTPSLPHTNPLVCPLKRFMIFFISLYLFPPLRKFSNYLSYQNIEKGGIIWCGAPTSKIWINPQKVMDENAINMATSALQWPIHTPRIS